MRPAIVLAVSAANADAILDGTRRFDRRSRPPRRLPARAYLAVVGTGTVVGECELGTPERRSPESWALPVTRPRRYARPRPLSRYGLTRTPRSFRYLDESGHPATR